MSAISDLGDLISIMNRVYLTELYSTPTDIPVFPRPFGVKPDASYSTYSCYTVETWRQLINQDFNDGHHGRNTKFATGKSGKPLWPYRCRPINVVSKEEDLNDQRLVLAIPSFLPAETFLAQMRSLVRDREDVSSLTMDIERQIEIKAFWTNRPDSQHDGGREAFRKFDRDALHGASYDLDRVWRRNEPRTPWLTHNLGAVLWDEPIKQQNEQGFTILEFRTRKFRSRF